MCETFCCLFNSSASNKTLRSRITEDGLTTFYFSVTSKQPDSRWWSWDAGPNKSSLLSASSGCRFAMHQSLSCYLRTVILSVADTVFSLSVCVCVCPRKKPWKTLSRNWCSLVWICYGEPWKWSNFENCKREALNS